MASYNLKLIKKQVVCDDVVTLDFISLAGDKIAYVSGQYMNLFRLSEEGDYFGRPYTIASIPQDNCIRFAIRRHGEFSSKLYNLIPGDTLIADGPHGTFYPPPNSNSLVCIAAGIGVAPFLSWVRLQLEGENKAIKTHLLFSNTRESRAPFLTEFFSYAKNNPEQFLISSYLTQQPGTSFVQKHHEGRIDTKEIKAIVSKLPGATVAICGSVQFTHDMWQSAKSVGIPENRLMTEAFF